MIEYYNVLKSGHKALGFSASGLIIIAFGIIVILIMKRNRAHEGKIVFMYFWTGFVILLTAVSFIGISSAYIECRNVIKNGTYKEVEGIVENFDPMPYSGHKDESFSVKGVLFKYSDYGVSVGFNNTKSHGGPIEEGKYVRIRYYDGLILQLWVKD